MEKKISDKEKHELDLIMRELKEDPFRKFNLAFYLMSLIPFLVFIYLLAAKFFTWNILIGDIGVIILSAAIIALCGFYIGYRIIKSILSRMLAYAIQAKRSDELKSTFVASVSHELKNPILTIKMSLSNIREGLAGKISEDQQKIIELCYSILDRMGRLINDLLDVHKIEAGMLDLKRRLCNIIDILDKQIREFEAMINQKHIRLNKEVLHKDLTFWADEDKITQVVNNLLSNALKYSPEGGSVTLKADYEDNFVRFECMDNGPGIPMDKMDKIFNKFERLNITKEGTGLGLAISKDIVELHKGKIWVENLPQGGSKFTVVLPRDLRKIPR
ncbi:MAG: cell wall metabolism sensor histidine kinase WalK [Candidatus Omnitrophica bacterium]|nr:cell wall metabolism sensor histidine kinase WalK [Candidatus Omnitrophota bacterium]